jgi:hypothetical protein
MITGRVTAPFPPLPPERLVGPAQASSRGSARPAMR